MMCLQKETDKAMSLFNMIKKRKKEFFYEYKIHKQIILPKTSATTKSL